MILVAAAVEKNSRSAVALSSQFEIVDLKWGGKSLRSVSHRETFHPVVGPEVEARILHVEQQRLRERAEQIGRLVIWDVGLGAAANALAAINALRDSSAKIEIHSFDLTLAPLEFALGHTDALGYLTPHRDLLQALLNQSLVEVDENILWHFHRGDFREQMERADIPLPHSVIYDPYSPGTNCEMWTLDHFTRLRQRLAGGPEYLLTNYTRATSVRVTWLMAGFYVGVGKGVGEKEETTIASNSLALLEQPLLPKFLQRVRTSHTSAPLRGPAHTILPIGESDLRLVEALPQFN